MTLFLPKKNLREIDHLKLMRHPGKKYLHPPECHLIGLQTEPWLSVDRGGFKVRFQYMCYLHLPKISYKKDPPTSLPIIS